MRGKLREIVRKRFAEHMKDRLPQFTTVDSEPIPRDCDLYGWIVSDNFSLYIRLQTHRKEDSFNIEIGWSDKGRWPQTLPATPGEGGQEGELRFRLPRLWRRDNIDVWWELDP